MQLFVLTNHCKTKVHCKACRSKEGGRQWRTSLKKMFQLPEDNVDFECPWGEAWIEETGTVALAAVEPATPEQLAATSVPTPSVPRPQLQKARNSGSRGSTGGCGCGRR